MNTVTDWNNRSGTIKNANKESNLQIEIIDEKGNEVKETEEIKTNDTIKITKGTEKIEYKAVKRGYINSDNKITISDLMKLLIHIAEENAQSPEESRLLKGAYLMAADINENGKTDMLDIIPLINLTIK